MGCANSKVDDLEDVARCKARKQYIGQAVSCYRAYAAAHTAYVEALKDMGAALRLFAETDLLNPSPPLPPPPRPPPRPPQYVDSFMRSPTLPATILQKQLPSSPQRSVFEQLIAHATKTQTLETIGERLECIEEQQDEEEEEEEAEGSLVDEQLHEYGCEGVDEEEDWDSSEVTTVVNKTNVKNKMAAPPSRKLSIILPARKTGKDFVDAILKVDDLFLKAYDSGMVVARLLGTPDSIDEGLNQRANGTKGTEIQQSHASVLDRLSALEKELYDEVKSFEILSLTYQTECAELLQLESKGREAGLGKMRANIKSLDRRIKLTVQHVDTASLAIATLRDDELYPHLLFLLNVSKKMWQEMYDNHQAQTVILQGSLKIDLLRPVDATCDRHMVSTRQLQDYVDAWHSTFKELIPTQRKYMENLNGWLKLNLIPLETASGEKLGHQTDLPTSVIPAIYKLCQEWHQALEKLPVQKVLEAIKIFLGLVQNIIQFHVEELKHKKKAETLARQLKKKNIDLQKYESRYFEPPAVVEEKQDLLDDPLKKRKNAIAKLSVRVDFETEKSAKAVEDSRNMTRHIFSSGLPSLFEAVTSFSRICSETYKELCKHLSSEGFPASSGTSKLRKLLWWN